MNRKIWTSLLLIGLALAAIVGGTLAWFTSQATIEPNVFTAGRLEIDANETWEYGEDGLTNWNPGDCTEKEITVEVTGTKRAFIRVQLNEEWEGVDEVNGVNKNGVYNERNAPNVNWWICDEAGENCVAWPNGKWQMITTGTGEDEATYWYYKGMFDPKEAAGPQKVTVLSKVCLDGAGTGNEFQGATYTLAMDFEAIQVTNEAVNDAWGVYWDGTDGEWKKIAD